LNLAPWTDAVCSLVERALPFSLVWQSVKQLDSALPPPASESPVFWVIAERIGHFALRQRAILTRAFAQAWARRISSHAACLWPVPAWLIPTGFAQIQKTALPAREPPVLFHEERLLPARASAPQAQGCRVAAGKIPLAQSALINKSDPLARPRSQELAKLSRVGA